MMVYSFTAPGEVRLLEVIKNSYDTSPEKKNTLIATFLNTTGFLKEENPNFEQDAAIIAQHCDIDIAQKSGRNMRALFTVNRDALEKNHPDTLLRFQQGWKDIRHMGWGGLLIEDIKNLQAIGKEISASIVAAIPKKPFTQRLLAGVQKLFIS